MPAAPPAAGHNPALATSKLLEAAQQAIIVDADCWTDTCIIHSFIRLTSMDAKAMSANTNTAVHAPEYGYGEPEKQEQPPRGGKEPGVAKGMVRFIWVC